MLVTSMHELYISLLLMFSFKDHKTNLITEGRQSSCSYFKPQSTLETCLSYFSVYLKHICCYGF